MRRIQIEYKTLIVNLHPLYDKFYKKRLEKEKKGKAKQKMKQARKRIRNPAQVISSFQAIRVFVGIFYA
jgi:hypothetical protein